MIKVLVMIKFNFFLLGLLDWFMFFFRVLLLLNLSFLL